jgi:hypothetical protein
MVDAPALAASTLAALEHAHTPRAVALLKGRLLQQQNLCEEDGTIKPFVELALFEIRDIARKQHLTADDKAKLVEMVLTIAGF